MTRWLKIWLKFININNPALSNDRAGFCVSVLIGKIKLAVSAYGTGAGVGVVAGAVAGAAAGAAAGAVAGAAAGVAALCEA